MIFHSKLRSGVAPDTFDLPTVSAVAVICYFAAVLVHEGLGHAGTTALLGGHVVQVTSAACDCDVSTLSPWAARAVYAGGCVANTLTGILVLGLRRLVRLERLTMRFGLWLFGHVSLFISAGYMMVFPFLPAGDWHDFVGGLSAPVIWRSGLTVLGVVGYSATMRHAQRSLEEFLGSDPRERRFRASKLTLLPYLVGGIVETLSAVVGGGGILVLISAAPATFGGTIGLPLSGRRAGENPRAQTAIAGAAVVLPRSRVVLALGVVAAAFHLFWLGPGLFRRH